MTGIVIPNNGNIGSTSSTDTIKITTNGDVEIKKNKKLKQKGSFMQSSFHQSLVLGG